MYACDACLAMFEDPAIEVICFEDYYGVGSMFPDRHYGNVSTCPECGSEEIYEVGCDEECDDCPHWPKCTLDIRKEFIEEYEPFGT